MPPHKYIVKGSLFDDEEEFARPAKYDAEGRLRVQQRPRAHDERPPRAHDERKQRALDASLASTRSALQLLDETDCIGTSTSAELERQGDCLRNVNGRLDGISADLELSKRRISSIESMFHSLKRRLTGRSKRARNNVNRNAREAVASEDDKPKYTECGFDEHPAMRIRGLSYTRVGEDSVERQIEDNLQQMASHVERLKDIGASMGREIDQQNKLLDVIHLKIDHAQVEVDGQTKRIKKLL